MQLLATIAHLPYWFTLSVCFPCSALSSVELFHHIPPLFPSILDLSVDLSHFSLQQGQDNVSSTKPQVARTHSMVLHPRPSKTANLSALSASRSASLPQQKLVSFKAANKYLIWHKAMQEELWALHHNDTWSLNPFAPSINVVGSRWMYKIKRHANGRVDKYKWLVARGFS